jgi:nicotinamidase-related amidase
MLKKENVVLILVDVQGHLSELMDGADALFKNIRRLLTGMYVLEIPVIVTEQTPDKLGKTRGEFRAMIRDVPVEKKTFSCCGELAFLQALEKTKRRQVILCGIETHVCVYQSAMELLAAGYEVYVVADAVSSRDPANKTLALRRMEVEGVKLTGTEMFLFELLGDTRAPQFKSILQIVK